MILGISGKIGSGKDTVGEIIRYLTYGSEEKLELICDIEDFNAYNKNHKFQIKKFADKLKDIVCILIGCTREQLEDRDFKEKELGEEWYKWKVKLVIGVKYFSTLEEAEYFIKYEHPLKMLKSTQNGKPELIKLTPRLLLQILGTEAGRGLIHPNIWVNALMSEYVDEHDLSTWGHSEKYLNWVVTDMRFSNEKKAIENKKGITIRVNRLNKVSCNNCQGGGCTTCNGYGYWIGERQNEHESETALDNSDFDYVIDNNGSIEELIEKVRDILIKEKVL